MDKRLQELERAAEKGDAQAAERLYWESMRLYSGPQLFDRLIEAVITLQTKQAPDVHQKLAFLRGRPVRERSPEQLERIRRRWTTVGSPGDLHRIPRDVRQPGFTTYCTADQCVYQLAGNGEWERLAQLSAEPPGHPFHVVQTLAERDALEVGHGEACLVLANRGLYRSSSNRNEHSGAHTISWRSIRFERRTS